MKKDVAVRVEIDPSYSGTEVIIKAEERSDLVDEIVLAIDQCARNRQPRITVFQGDTRVFLRQQDIIRIYTEKRKLIVHTIEGEDVARCTLRELEETLVRETFTRISRFEIVNMTRIASFDFSLSGTIRIFFDDESITYVSRRYVHEIEQKLTQWKE
jgi:DNA-binding LytR/AlgR family response regulator